MGARTGTFAELLADASHDVRAIAEALRALVLDVHGDAVEVVRLGDRAACFGVGPKKMSEAYVYVTPHTQWVNLGFFRGALLADPAGLLEGTGAKMRHVKVRAVREVAAPALRRLVQAAWRERVDALGGA